MRCTIWYHLHNLKNVKNTHGGMLLLVKLQALHFIWKPVIWFAVQIKWLVSIWNTKPATCTLLHGCFFTFLKLCKWYQIAQRITYRTTREIETKKYFKGAEVLLITSFHLYLPIAVYNSKFLLKIRQLMGDFTKSRGPEWNQISPEIWLV